MRALAAALLMGVLAAPFALQAQDPSFLTPLLMCTVPPSPGTDTWPRAVTDSLGSTAGVPVTFSAATLIANDTGASLTVRQVGPLSSRGGTITSTGPFTYTPLAGFVGADIFTYEIGDAAGQTTIGIVTISVTPDLVAPTVSISAPFGGTVSASVIVRASASDNVGVAGVTFFDGIAQIGQEVTASPFQTTWDTTLVADGTHSLHAVARDAAGNTATSARVGVTVSNASPPPPPPPPPPPSTAGLVLSFSFDEADGQPAIDASPSGRNGVITGAVRVPGKVGRALQFDGIDNWVTVIDGAAGTPLDLTSGMTLEAWVNPTVLDGWETVILKEGGVNLLSYALYAHDGAPLAGGFAAPAGYVRAQSIDQAIRDVSALALNTWTHLATTYDGTTQRIYVNGVEVASRPQDGGISGGDEPLRIGGNASFAGEFYQGLIDEVKVYNRALAAAEIGLDMGSVAAPPPPTPTPTPTPTDDLVLSLSFDEASGATAIDSSTSARNGTIAGAERVPGKVGGALSFDGIDDWVTVVDGATDTALDLTAGMTVEAWVNPAALNGWNTVVLKERGENALSYGLYAHDGAPLAGGFAAPAGYVRAQSIDQAIRDVSALPLNTWTHLATTYDGTTQRIYVNGVEVASRPQDGDISVGDEPLRIGGNASFVGEFFQGLIDEVKVYNRALTAAEINAHMNVAASSSQ